LVKRSRSEFSICNPVSRDQSPALSRTNIERQGQKITLAVGILAFAMRAAAADGDGLTLHLAERITHDDNLFRISGDKDPAAYIGAPSRADTYRTVSAGLDMEVPLARQRFQAGWLLNQDRHDRFTDLDFTGHDGRAIWLWQIDARVSGQIGFVETVALAPFTDIQARLPDVLKTRRSFYTASYAMTPRWSLQAARSRLEQRNGDPLRKASDVDIDDSELTISYATPAQNRAGLSAKEEKGYFPGRAAGISGVLDNTYSQYSAGILVDWTLTGASRLDVRVDRVNRRYGQLPSRNFEGNTFRVAYEWRPTVKTRLEAIVQRDISAYEDIRSTFVLVRGTALQATFKATEKIEILGTYVHSTRKYLGDPGQGLGDSPRRNDLLRSSGGKIVYRPTRAVSLQMSLQREVRASNISGADYRFAVISVEAGLAF